MEEPSTPAAPPSPPPPDDDEDSISEPLPPPSPPPEKQQQPPLLLRRLSSRSAPSPPEAASSPPSPQLEQPAAATSATAVVAPEPPPPSAPSPSSTPPKPVKRVRFADQQPRPLPCFPSWWRGVLHVLLTPTERRKRLQAARYRLEDLLRGRLYLACIVLLTAYILLADQLRLAALPPAADPAFRVLNTLAFALLLLEMLATCWVYDDYCFHLGPPLPATGEDRHPLVAFWQRLHGPSFFFWLDLLGVLLLPFDPTFLSYVSHPNNIRLLDTSASTLSGKAVRTVRALRATSFLRLLKYAGVPSLGCAACFCYCLAGAHDDDHDDEDDDDDNAAGSVHSSKRPRRRGSKSFRPRRQQQAGRRPRGLSGQGRDPEEEDNRLATAVTASLHRKVVVGGLLLLLVAPFLDYAAPDTTWSLLFAALDAVAAGGNATAIAGFATLLANTTGAGLGLLEVAGVAYVDRPQGPLRADEVVTHTMADANGGAGGDGGVQARVVLDARSLSRMWAWESLLLTLAVFLLFWGLAAALRHDLDRLVFHPLAQMVRLVRRIARNPLAPIRELDEYGGEAAPPAGSEGEEGGGPLSVGGAGAKATGRTAPQGLETAALLQTIGKIGALMRIGLGAAGADIISRNLLLESESAPRLQEGLELRMAGKLVSAVFVFCDVRNFTDATECLQEEVMVFVNKIAAILHELTVRCGGAPNKNVGDAFLLIWKVAVHEEEEEGEEEEEEEDGASSLAASTAAADPEAKTRRALAEGPQGAQAAGRALYCVLKFTVELARLHAYVCRFSSAASQRLFARLPGYRVGVGFGLHVGWAVEGPIGSTQKIDVSYVSPHVTASEYLQDLTKEYGVVVLISEAFYHALPPAARYNCRQVDCVRRTAAASSGGGFLAEPMSLYTYDCDPEQHMQGPRFGSPPPSFSPSRPAGRGSNSSSSSQSQSPNGRRSPPPPQQQAGRSAQGATVSFAPSSSLPRAQSPQRRQSVLDPLQSITVRPYSDGVWDADPDLQHIATKLHPNFRATWNYAMSSYLAGEWTSARRGFETCLELSQGRDGPSKRLLAVLEQHGPRAPAGWAGFRELEG